MNDLLDDILLVGKSESGGIILNSTHIALTKFCQELVEKIRLSAGSNHVINFVSQGDDSRVCLDEQLLHRILSNLLSNAIKYSPQGRKVNFNLICEPHQATFEIKNCGIGIPPKDIKQLFISFHRGSNVKLISGTGWGLSIIIQYIDLHDVTVTVNSEMGVRTIFIVVLPFIFNN